MSRKKAVPFLFVIISVIILSLFVLQNSVLAQHRNGASDDAMPAVSSQDIEIGWYYGSLNQKKPGTPDDWIHDSEGTRSACWHKRGVRCGQGKPETSASINSFDECAQAGYGIAESYPRRCRTPDGRLFIEHVPPREHPRKQCAKENEMCGGIAGILCCPGLACKYGGNYPDAGGVCITFPDPREEIFLKFNPPLTNEQQLIVPNTVYVETPRKAVKVELYAGPTGTGVAGLERLIESNSKPIESEMAGLYRFVFPIKNCDQVSSRFIARVYWDDGKVSDQLSEPLYCK